MEEMGTYTYDIPVSGLMGKLMGFFRKFRDVDCIGWSEWYLTVGKCKNLRLLETVKLGFFMFFLTYEK
jgi:hypothetical protein